MTHLLLPILLNFLTPAHACGTDVIATDESARRQMSGVAASLPVLFRYEVTFDDRLGAVVATPKCVTTWEDEPQAWIEFYAARTHGAYPWNWTLEVNVPTLTQLVKTQDGPNVVYRPGAVTESTIRMTYDRLSWRKWSGEILRSQLPDPPLALPLELSGCKRRAVNTFSYRTKNGTLISPELWRYQLRHSPEGQSCSM